MLTKEQIFQEWRESGSPCYVSFHDGRMAAQAQIEELQRRLDFVTAERNKLHNALHEQARR